MLRLDFCLAPPPTHQDYGVLGFLYHGLVHLCQIIIIINVKTQISQSLYSKSRLNTSKSPIPEHKCTPCARIVGNVRKSVYLYC